MVEDRQDEVWNQYDFEVYNRYRARGAVLLDTDRGYKWMKNFEGSRSRLAFENRVLLYIKECGYRSIDYILSNREGEIISMDSSGNSYVVKNWFRGEEISMRDLNCAVDAAKNLAIIHTILKSVPDLGEEVYYENFNLDIIFDKHNKELRRVRSYIRDKKCRNEFEICMLNTFNEFYGQAALAVDELRRSAYRDMCYEAKHNSTVSHGNYTYHNVLITRDGLATTNFDKCSIGIQVFDLYFFLRKAMEKNYWDITYGETILYAYNSIKPLTKREWKMLYILLLYPEKYWKVINFYYNNKKSWVSQRNTQKLIGLKEQQRKKDEFLKKLEYRW